KAAIIPTLDGQDSQSIPTLPGTSIRGQEDTLSWYFRGVPLGLDMIPGISRAGGSLTRGEVPGKPSPSPRHSSGGRWSGGRGGRATGGGTEAGKGIGQVGGGRKMFRVGYGHAHREGWRWRGLYRQSKPAVNSVKPERAPPEVRGGQLRQTG